MATNNNNNSTSIIPSWALNGTRLGSNDSYLLLNIFPNDIADNLFDQLRDEITWNEMRQKGGRVPRDISIQGTLITENGDEYEPLYRHPADEQPELVSWTPAALKIKERIEELIEQKLNHALIQYYRNGKDFIGEHSDKTLDVLFESNIVNYSLGAARTMILKHKTQDGLKQRFKLPHNSLFVMGWKTNREWFHSIKQDNRADRDKEQDELAFSSQRISLTLRTIATFRNRRTGQLFGQGARCKTIEQISEEQQLSNESDEQDMLMAFSAENKLSLDFDWNQYYGHGFNALNFKVLNSVFKEEENKDLS
jgi:alkylated DNA repair dioxygenase AlkB